MLHWIRLGTCIEGTHALTTQLHMLLLNMPWAPLCTLVAPRHATSSACTHTATVFKALERMSRGVRVQIYRTTVAASVQETPVLATSHLQAPEITVPVVH